ncbi:cytochrome P450 72A225-like isoform X2 [Triticum dicoccoides]|uniref:cytochrome P450 72A225-like isoform X2 n=1 Tax=Triticum dicoccoides TaxID=85692 RepID=UPI00189006BF|nr:cytochrome P450 72A225-like isoform X2 [Triticum dicoccoides]
MVLNALMSPASVPWSSLGLRDMSYRFLIGDLMDYRRRNKEARSRSMPLRCHNIAPLFPPFLHDLVREHGKTCVSWFSVFPKVTISDPDLAKEVLSNKFGHFEKLKFPALSRLLAGGLAAYNSEKWVKHRRILNPAFHLEKLKLMMPALSTCCQELVDRWARSLGSDGSYELDVFPELQRLTGDVISRTSFGSNYLEVPRFSNCNPKKLNSLWLAKEDCASRLLVSQHLVVLVSFKIRFSYRR